MGLTGNLELSKDALQKHINFITINNSGVAFLKKLLKQIDIIEKVREIEDRFLPDGDKDFLIMILESLHKG